MASIWDFLDSLPKRSDVTPEELARRRQGYADLYQGGLLAGNRDQMPLSVQGAQATQDFLPVIGDALALGEAGQALSRGELAAAGLLGAGAAIGLVPAAGDALAKPVMAAGRRAADIARRIEVDPNALGSMGGNIRLRPQAATIEDQVAAARKAVIDSPNDENLFLEYKRLRRMRDDGVSTFPQAEAPAPQVSAGLLGDYVGQHRAPTRDAGAPAFSLAGDIYPDDIYSSKAVQYYGTGSDAMDSKTMGLLQSLRGKPDADVTIYRAVPKGVDDLNAGDWVTVNKQYAKDHGESALGGDFDIIEKKVKAKDIFTNGDSIHEFGYDPTPPSPAQEVAGLLSSGRANEVTDEMLAKFTPKDEMEIFDLYQRGSTGMDLPMDEASRMARAAEQERTANQFHGAMGDYRDLRPSVRGKIGPGVYTAEEPNYANSFAGKVYGEDEYLEGGNVYPLMVKDNPAPDMFRTEAGALRRSVSDPFEGADLFSRYLDDLGFSGVKVGGEQTTVNPSNIRSRFARFDPRLAHLRNLSAGVGGLGLLSSMMPPEEQY
jgi:hypothetical protein